MTIDADVNPFASSIISETQQLKDSLCMNLLIFTALISFFEVNRHFKAIYGKRISKKFLKTNRVPPIPSKIPLAWVYTVLNVSDDEILRMVGLDGYMLIRYITVCLRISLFLTVWGIAILLPVYSNAQGDISIGWNKYTIANIPLSEENNHYLLWIPCIFAYVFSAYYCRIMYTEYENFVKKRVEYLVKGDVDTPPQTYYTIIVERLPASLRSTPALKEFFKRLFPNDVYSVEIALDLTKLDVIIQHRALVRHNLEKAIAIWKATKTRPLIWVSEDFYKDLDNPLVPTPFISSNIIFNLYKSFGYIQYDAIRHHYRELSMLNDNVYQLQRHYLNQMHEHDKKEEMKLDIETITETDIKPPLISTSLSNYNYDPIDRLTNSKSSELVRNKIGVSEFKINKEEKKDEKIDIVMSINNSIDYIEEGIALKNIQVMQEEGQGVFTPRGRKFVDAGVKIVGNAAFTAGKEGFKTVTIATKGALQGVLEATRTLELLTVGAYYKTSSTAFVTFKSRVANSCSHQMLLSHEHHALDIKAAPNPKDIIWDNLPIPQRQISSRKSIANWILSVGAIFWSAIVGFIATIANLDYIAKENGWGWLNVYHNTPIYNFLNNYLALALLLCLLALLPLIFDTIARYYEGLKLESEIQNSISNRYFYYQLANVFVSVGLGSLATSIHHILDRPSSIFAILGTSVPSFSLYFANLLIIKIFTGLPIEMLRMWPLFEILTLKTCMDTKKCTTRELQTGAFADPPITYGWIYPNLLMVLMIMLTYCCIAPLLMPFSLIFFAFAYVMYKYQLLYVFINDYQSGGFMWYEIFSHSMVGLLCGVITLFCYMGIRESFSTGPFYALTPLPALIYFYWDHCTKKFEKSSMTLSLESAISIDKLVKEEQERLAKEEYEKYEAYPIEPIVPNKSFRKTLFRQPSLVSGSLKPAKYRKPATRMHDYNQSSSRRNCNRDSNSSSSSTCSTFSTDCTINGNKEVGNLVALESIQQGEEDEIKNISTEEEFEENDTEFDEHATVNEILDIVPSTNVKSIKPSGIPSIQKQKKITSVFSAFKKAIGKKSSSNTDQENLPLMKKDNTKLKSNSSYGTTSNYKTPSKRNNFDEV